MSNRSAFHLLSQAEAWPCAERRGGAARASLTSGQDTGQVKVNWR